MEEEKKTEESIEENDETLEGGTDSPVETPETPVEE